MDTIVDNNDTNQNNVLYFYLYIQVAMFICAICYIPFSSKQINEYYIDEEDDVIFM